MGRLSPLEVPGHVSNQPGRFVASLAGLDKRSTMQTYSERAQKADLTSF
jgi:hypothetical protein